MSSNGNARERKLSILLLTTLLFLSYNPAYAVPSAQEIEAAIRESKDVPKDKRFTVAASGTEAQIATYIEPGSKDSDKDCKIDSVLLARIVISKFSEINRVVVNFYGFGGKTYKQTTVTKPEILAFGSGQVESSELLSAIRLEERVDEKLAASEKNDEKQKEEKKQSHSDASKEAYKKAVEKKQDPETSWVPYVAAGKQGYPGVTFQYPEVWRISRELDGDVLVSIKGAQSTVNEPKIELKLYRNPKKLDVMKEAQKHARGHQDYKKFAIIKPSAVTRIGVGGAITAVCENFSYTRSDNDTAYERHYYFGWPGYVYKIMSSATKHDSAHVDRVFNKLLSTLKMAAAGK